MHPLLRLVWSLPPHVTLLFVVPLILVITSIASSILIACIVRIAAFRLRTRNPVRRRIALATIDIHEHDHQRILVGFFHPYCDAGGGGERVLWAAVRALQQSANGSNIVIMVYTGDVASERGVDQMVAKVQDRFGIALDSKTIVLVPLRRRRLVEATTWPRFTLLGQSLGSILLAYEGLSSGCIPDVWIDTMGYAFAYPLIRHVCRVPVGSYTHYPTISTDMLQRVHDRQEGHTNTALVAHSAVLSYGKYFYYLIFAELYSLCLKQADVLVVNSTWTKRHIDRLLRPFGRRDDDDEPGADCVDTASELDEMRSTQVSLQSDESTEIRQRGTANRAEVDPGSNKEPLKKQAGSKHMVQSAARTTFRTTKVVYPPCDTLHLSALPLTAQRTPGMILSLAQFRPEKEHTTQLRAISLLLKQHPEYRESPGSHPLKLLLAGSVRDSSDKKRVTQLRQLAKELNIEDFVEFAVNIPYADVKTYLSRASIGLHSMVDEHFGITVVEFMAAGLVPLVHASAGPLLDIVTPYQGQPTGFHATTPASFATQLAAILELEREQPDVVTALRGRARMAASERFGETRFEEDWLTAWNELSLSSSR